jgi:hypothetical protein
VLDRSLPDTAGHLCAPTFGSSPSTLNPQLSTLTPFRRSMDDSPRKSTFVTCTHLDVLWRQPLHAQERPLCSAQFVIRHSVFVISVPVRIIRGHSDLHHHHASAHRFVAKPITIPEKMRVLHHESRFSTRTQPSHRSQLQAAQCLPTDPCPNTQTQNSKFLGVWNAFQSEAQQAVQNSSTRQHITAGRIERLELGEDSSPCI